MLLTPYTKLQATPDFANFQFSVPNEPTTTVWHVRFIPTEGGEIYMVDLRAKQQEKKDPALPDPKDFPNLVSTLVQIIEIYSERYPRRILRFCGDSTWKYLSFRTMLKLFFNALSPLFLIKSDQAVPYRGRGDKLPMPFRIMRRPVPYLTVNTIQSTWEGMSRIFGKPFSVEMDRSIRVGLTLPTC